MRKHSLQTELESKAKELGADLFGVADLTVAKDFICQQGGEYLLRFPRAISIGIRLLDSVVDELPQHEYRTILYTYRALYNTANSRLDHIGLILAKMIQDKGCLACPIPASQTIDHTQHIGAISHKLPAHLAGLGWIGKSCLLITPKYGPRVRLTTVLTDAPLQPGVAMEEKCGNCTKCVNICPAKAFTGAKFDPSEPREIRFNAHLCHDYMEERRKKFGEELCGLCVYVCPYGKPKR